MFLLLILKNRATPCGELFPHHLRGKLMERYHLYTGFASSHISGDHIWIQGLFHSYNKLSVVTFIVLLVGLLFCIVGWFLNQNSHFRNNSTPAVREPSCTDLHHARSQ